MRSQMLAGNGYPEIHAGFAITTIAFILPAITRPRHPPASMQDYMRKHRLSSSVLSTSRLHIDARLHARSASTCSRTITILVSLRLMLCMHISCFGVVMLTQSGSSPEPSSLLRVPCLRHFRARSGLRVAMSCESEASCTSTKSCRTSKSTGKMVQHSGNTRASVRGALQDLRSLIQTSETYG